jgi:hypothetical protein
MLIDIDASVAHAHEMNKACDEMRDFTLTNRNGVTGAITSHGRMLYSKHIAHTFDQHGGFWALHESGICEYAYASSDYAREAKKNPMETAKRMLQSLWDSIEHYHSQNWFAGSMAERRAKFIEAAFTK